MRTEAVESFNPQSKDQLRSFVGGEAIEKWQDGFNNLDTLWEEYIKRECLFSWEVVNGRSILVRNLNIASVQVFYDDPQFGPMQLREAEQRYIDPEGVLHIRKREIEAVGGKIKIGQTPLEGATAEVNEELFKESLAIEPSRLWFVNCVAGELDYDDGYPGLLARHNKHYYVLELMPKEYNPSGYEEQHGTRVNRYTWFPVRKK